MLALARRPSRDSLELSRVAPWVAIHSGDERTSSCRFAHAEAMSLTQIEPAANSSPAVQHAPAANSSPAAAMHVA
jgi:hypothetical protein